MGLPCIPDNEHTTSTIVYNTDDIIILNKISLTVIVLQSIIKPTQL